MGPRFRGDDHPITTTRCRRPRPQVKSVGLLRACQLASGIGLPCTDVTLPDDVICDPFMSHSASEPVVAWRHSMSDLPSPLKSPISTRLQLASGVASLLEESVMFWLAVI